MMEAFASLMTMCAAFDGDGLGEGVGLGAGEMGVGVAGLMKGSSGSGFVVPRHVSMMSLESVVSIGTLWGNKNV